MVKEVIKGSKDKATKYLFYRGTKLYSIGYIVAIISSIIAIVRVIVAIIYNIVVFISSKVAIVSSIDISSIVITNIS